MGGSMEEVDDDFSVEPPVVVSPEKYFDLNSTLSSLGETPVKLHSLAPSSKRMKGQEKLASAPVTLKRQLETVYNVSLESPESDLDSSEKLDLELFRNMLEEVKDTFNKSKSYQEYVQILTLSPLKESETTNYTKKLCSEEREGLCDKKQGKALSNELKEAIVQFYESDENSLGMKDTLSI